MRLSSYSLKNSFYCDMKNFLESLGMFLSERKIEYGSFFLNLSDFCDIWGLSVVQGSFFSFFFVFVFVVVPFVSRAFLSIQGYNLKSRFMEH